jgi:3-oxoacyl-[acyl-carrier-protein] synthase III
MGSERYAAVTGWGMALPERVVTNDDLAQIVDTSDEWIRSRTGIAARRIVGEGEFTSTLASEAGRKAIERAGLRPEQIDTIILATCTPDRPFPATACTVQANLQIPRAAAFDLVAACSGFVYGIGVANSLIRSGASKTTLLIACDIFTHLLNWQDRNTCVLFGDGAGAVVLQATSEPLGVLAATMGAWGEGEDLMAAEAGGTRMPLTAELIEQQKHKVTMNGREVFKHAVREMTDSSLRVIAEAGLTIDDIALVVPHQANVRIIDATGKRLEIDPERVFVNIAQYGNTSAASVPIALCEAAEQGRIKAGEHVLLTAFGGGLTWASAVVRWGRPE